VESLFAGEMSADEIQKLLTTIYYPHEAIEYWRPTLSDSARRREFVRLTLRRQFRIVRALASSRRLSELRELIPPERRELFQELFAEPLTGRGEGYVNEMIETLCEHDRDFSAVRAASRLVR
ncbi:MAG: fructose-bisphosphatase class III, partial [Acidobacteriota bacterium]|nr:fructose-bisphosphatase class III [Acidobacteriota bacterium]